MLLIFFISILILSNFKINRNSFEVALPMDHSNALKGIGISVVFFNHLSGYLKEYEITQLTSTITYIIAVFTTLFVALFLFLSGYGVTESMKKKGKLYIKSYPKKRLLGTLLNYDVAVVVFFVLTVFLGNHVSFNKLLLSLVAWDNLGNSNWYIFCILYCYISSFLAVKLFRSQQAQLICIFIFIILYIIIVSQYKQGWWYNTVLAYFAGVLYSNYKDRIDVFVKSHYVVTFPISSLLFVFLMYLSTNNPYLFNITAIMFCFSIIIISYKIQLGNHCLIWAGQNLFNLYIYQRLPMIVLSKISNINLYLYVILCITITIIISLIIPRISLK